VHDSHKALLEVDDNILLIAGDPKGVLGKQLRPFFEMTNFNILIIHNYELNYQKLC
jgi:hypothetical protein